jgi:hypothetical protein
MLTLTPQQIRRFNAKVQRSAFGCWIWTGAMTGGKHGRAHLFINGIDYPATHVAWYLAHGEWPDRWVLHTCDNPACMRPSHLFLGTAKDNTDDMIAKGRGNTSIGLAAAHAKLAQHPELRPKGEQNGNSTLTNDDVRRIKKMYGKVKSGAIAAEFGISRQHVWAIGTGKRHDGS